MTVPAQDHYTDIVLDTVACSKELAESLSESISNSENEQVKLSLLEAQCIASQLRITANLVDGLLKEHNTIMVRVNELIDEATKKRRK